MRGIANRGGLWRIIYSILLLAAFLSPAVQPIRAEAAARRLQQTSGYGFSLEPSGNWQVKSSTIDSILTGIEPGCWGAYANAFGDGSGTPWADGTINKWGRISDQGEITGGCWIKEGINSDGRLIKGSISGAYLPGSDAISKLHLETSETITNTVDGKVEWATTLVSVDVNGGTLSPPDTQYTHQVSGKFSITWKGSNFKTKGESGTVTFRLTLIKIEQPYRLRVEQIDNNPGQPGVYQPARFRFTLEELDGQDGYKPLKDSIVKLTNVWGEESVHFLSYFEASNCQNCENEVVGSRVFFRTKKVPDEIQIKTDPSGQFTLTLYLNIGKMAAAGIHPTPASPLARKFKAAYYGSPPGTAPLVETFVALKVPAVGIIEWIGYREPGLYDGNGNPQPLRWPKNLSDFAEDPGVKVESWTLRAAERVRVFRAGEGWFVQEGQAIPGTRAAPGTLITANTDLTINACELDAGYKNSYANQRIYKPGEIRVKIRFFDGVHAMISVNSDVCSDTFNMAVSTGDLKQVETLQDAVFNYVISKIQDKGIEMVAEKFIPFYEVFDGIKTAVEVIQLIPEVVDRKSIFVRLNSRVLIETNVDGQVRLTTREGNPVVYTAATGGHGVVVPAGQTASIPGSFLPLLEPTPPEIAKNADDLLLNLSGDDAAGGQASPGVTPITPTLLLAFLFIGVCGLGMLGVVAAGAWVWSRRRKTKPVQRVRQPATPRLTVLHGSASPQMLIFTSGSVTLGRDQGCGMILHDPLVSRQHARIETDGSRWAIRDLGSANGTFVNGVRIQHQAIRPDDRIQIGGIELIFQV